MTYQFLSQLPDDFSGQSILRSEEGHSNFRNQEFLIVEENGSQYFFEIKYNVHCSPFKGVCLLDKVLGVGHEENFYLFDLETKTNLVSIKIEGYFSHVYLIDKLFYVAGANGLYCLDNMGKIIWMNLNLGMDGVVIENFDNEVIFGAGEWDPPNGWRKFRLNKLTGELI